MSAVMGVNGYGKQEVRLVLVRRSAGRHELRDLTVSLRLEGDFASVYTEGDNAPVLPTDTMRATVYALAREHLTGSLEEFGEALAQRLLDATPAAARAVVSLTEHPWSRLRTGGEPHPHAFTSAGGMRWTGQVSAARSDAGRAESAVTSGIAGLVLLRTTGSSFSGFLRDEYTVLAETDDRVLATELTASWEYRPDGGPGPVAGGYEASREGALSALLEAFAGHEDSRSVQHTLYVLGSAVLDARPEIARISLTMPNLHHIAVDLTPFGQPNANEVFVATDRPYGLIEGTVERRE